MNLSVHGGLPGVGLSVPQNNSVIRGQSVARRMSWAANRQTTQIEDTAYCLLGIIDLNMPLLYGEGRKAFIRLQEEILKTSEDQSLFAWPLQFSRSPSIPPKSLSYPDYNGESGCLSNSPDHFAGAHAVVPYFSEDTVHSMTNRGLRINALLVNHDQGVWWILNCRYKNKPNSRLGIQLFADYGGTNTHFRDRRSIPRSFDLSTLQTSEPHGEAKVKTHDLYSWSRPQYTKSNGLGM
jgi:hypothetical protein